MLFVFGDFLNELAVVYLLLREEHRYSFFDWQNSFENVNYRPRTATEVVTFGTRCCRVQEDNGSCAYTNMREGSQKPGAIPHL
jgi:hypothetical protein